MNSPTRVLTFVAGCAAIFAVALGVGSLVGPINAEPAEADHGEGMGAMDSEHVPGHDVGGLEASADGYSLVLAAGQLEPGRQRLAFTVTGPDGDPVTSYDQQHERDLHLVVVRRDLTGFQHVHPTLDTASGEWSVDVDLTPGAWRVLADFAATGAEPLVLGGDLLVPGGFTPEPLGEDRSAAQVDDYDVSLSGDLVAGEETVLTATVTRAGRPVSDLQPYLGAFGHLVSLRDGDIGYLHVHPHEDGEAGPEIVFDTEFPSAGRYRLFLDFRHDGMVHTAAFTVTVEGHDEH